MIKYSVLFLVATIQFSLAAQATSKLDFLEGINPLQLSPPTTSAALFCDAFVGSWQGSCTISDNSQSSQVNEVFTIQAYKNCFGMRAGNDYGNINGAKEIITLNPAIPSLGLLAEHKSQNIYWSWSVDHSTLSFSAKNTIKTIGVDGLPAEVTVTGDIYLENGILKRVYKSDHQRNVSCSYSKLSQISDDKSSDLTSMSSFFKVNTIANVPPQANQCTDFSGQWKGTCTFETQAYTDTWTEEITTQQNGCDAVLIGDDWTRVGSVRTTIDTRTGATPDIAESGTFLRQINWNAKKTELIIHQEEVVTRMVNPPLLEQAQTEGKIFLRDDGKLVRRSTPHGNCYSMCVYDKVP